MLVVIRSVPPGNTEHYTKQNTTTSTPIPVHNPLTSQSS